MPLRLISSARRAHRRGFTFVELMVVVSICLILLTMAMPMYTKSIRSTREGVLRSNLFTLRTVVRNYTALHQQAPQDLSELVAAGMLKSIPIDPMTHSNQTWRTVKEEDGQGVSPIERGIVDVKSGSSERGLDGTPYNEW